MKDIIEALVPVLLAEAEQAIGAQPSTNQAWIAGLVNEMMSLIGKKVPSWLLPSEQELAVLVEDAIAKVLNK